jgi:NAD(P)-dependent dehydrogenase (short-subunit alcohol dehydrogenase family)
MIVDSLNGKIVLITGVRGKIGRGVAKALRANGVIVYGIDTASNKENDPCTVFTADIRDDDALSNVSHRLGELNIEKIDGLVCCAALDSVPGHHAAITREIERIDFEIYKERIDVNINGQLNVVRNLSPKLAYRSSIVLFSSIYGLVSPDHRIYPEGFFKPIDYTVSKAALIGLGKYLAVYFSERAIRVNCLAMGGIYDGQNDEFVCHYSKKTPFGRMADIDEAIGPVLFLLSDLSTYMTGSVLTVDGGFTAW